jgi:hypothetical protein
VTAVWNPPPASLWRFLSPCVEERGDQCMHSDPQAPAPSSAVADEAPSLPGWVQGTPEAFSELPPEVTHESDQEGTEGDL